MSIQEVKNVQGSGPWIIGDIRIDRILEIEWRGFPARYLLPELNDSTLDRHRDRLERSGLTLGENLTIQGAMHSFLVRTPTKTIIVDTGCGNGRNRPNRPHYHQLNTPYLKRLGAVGVHPHDVTHVLCTHLHGDHVGWNTQWNGGQWNPTFPNARYLIPRLDWIHWKESANRAEYNDDPFFEDSIEPVLNAGLIDLIDDGHEIDCGLRVQNTPGHTPGHVCLNIFSKDGKATLCGDIVHSPLQIDLPQLNSCFCFEPEQSLRTRTSLLEQWHEEQTLVLPAHFPTPSAGFITDAGQGFLRFQFVTQGSIKDLWRKR